ncbi:hypothetical protein Taro_037155, partial [Colocasia esculenta]|nr:hypothetical protein [Colocasia esculenta]
AQWILWISRYQLFIPAVRSKPEHFSSFGLPFFNAEVGASEQRRAMETAEGETGGGLCASASSPSPSLSREGCLSCRQAPRQFRLYRWILRLLLVVGWCIPLAFGVADGGVGRGPGRSLLGFRQTQGNVSFQCSPSGPCLPCQYSEKNDENYRCSETGYRIPLKCVEVKAGVKETSGKRSLRSLFSINGFTSLQQFRTSLTHLKQRKLLGDSSQSQGGRQSYITYRSCLPAEAEEKLSVIGFEMIMVCLLLVSGSVVYIRQKRNIPFPGIGAVRIPTNFSRL